MKPSESNSDVVNKSDRISESVYECLFCEYQDIDASTLSYFNSLKIASTISYNFN